MNPRIHKKSPVRPARPSPALRWLIVIVCTLAGVHLLKPTGDLVAVFFGVVLLAGAGMALVERGAGRE